VAPTRRAEAHFRTGLSRKRAVALKILEAQPEHALEDVVVVLPE
jgi:hypothetical protein